MAITKRQIAEVDNLVSLNLDSTGKNQGISEAKRYKDSLEKAAANGWLGDVAGDLLALRGVSTLHSPTGFDNGKALIQVMAQQAFKAAPGTTVTTQCNNEARCDKTLISTNEMRATFHEMPPTAAMNPNRGLPVTHRGAAEIGFIDAIMSPELYTINGGSTRADIVATVTELFKKHSRTDIEAEFGACSVAVSGDVPSCLKAGARKGLVFEYDHPEVRYNGSDFVGAGANAGTIQKPVRHKSK